MHQLYDNLSDVYEMMYQSFIDYDDEYLFYSKKLLANNCSTIAEIGCGTGNLAEKFLANSWHYCGLDLSDAMLKKAMKRNPDGAFILGDMRNFSLPEKVDACIITGRTISYMITNEDVVRLFHSINKNLEHTGLICFDFIDANKFIPAIVKEPNVVHTAEYKERIFKRESFWENNNDGCWMLNWQSVYYEKGQQNDFIEIGKDESLVRAFTVNDMMLFLQLAGFEIIEMVDRPSYFFETVFCTAQKIKTAIT